MSHISDLMMQVNSLAERRGWHENRPTFIESLAMVYSSLSKTIDEYMLVGDNGTSQVFHSTEGTPEGVPIALAETMLRIMHLASVNGILLESAVIELLNHWKKQTPLQEQMYI